MNRCRLEVKPNGLSNSSPRKATRSVTELEQVSGRELAAGDVVADHVGQTLDRRSMRVDDHDRDRGGRQPYDVLRARRERDDEQAVRALREREVLQVLVALLDRLDVVDDEIELAVAEDRVHAAQPLRGLRPGQEGRDDADRQGATEAQASRRVAGRVVELGHRVEHPLTLGRGRRALGR